MNAKLIKPVVFLIVVALVVLGGVQWFVNRVYVPEGSSLWLVYKGPLFLNFGTPAAAANGFAEPGEIGVLPDLHGPGRHFWCPLWWERKVVPDLIVKPGEVAVVRSLLGDDLPAGQILVDGDVGHTQHKGMLRKVLGPGQYRIHPYAYQTQTINTKIEKVGLQTKHSGWVRIDVGFVGVVTNLMANKATGRTQGTQTEVLPPGLYMINPEEQQIDIVEIGYRATDIQVLTKKDGDGSILLDESGEPMPITDSGITFPSNDGFKIQLDFVAIWGVLPDQAAQLVRTFGSIDAVEQKVILPQSESICRNTGSKMKAVELLVGATREKFQEELSLEFGKVLDDKNIDLLYGLVKHTYIPQEVRLPIQQGYIADELKLTREQERQTATQEAKLREAEKKVELQTETTKVETVKLTANKLAEGQKKARETEATSKRMVAEIDRKIAELDAKKQVLLGEAKAKADQLQSEAKSQKFKLAVEAFGSGEAFNKWQFAQGLPEMIDLQLFYAGEGTLWTDLKGIMPTLPVTPTKPAPGK